MENKLVLFSDKNNKYEVIPYSECKIKDNKVIFNNKIIGDFVAIVSN